MLAVLLDKRPQLQECHEIRALICEQRVRLIGLLAPVRRAFARVLHRQRRGNHHDLTQTAGLGGRNQHATNPRIHRQARQTVAEPRNAMPAVDGGQFLEQLVAVADQARIGRIDERE